MECSIILMLTSTADEDSPVTQQIFRIQSAIENALSSEIGREKESFLKEAYGPHPYQCHIPTCSRFYAGFSTFQGRNAHLKKHERSFLCPFQDCDFHSVGFPTKRALENHSEMFHVETLLPQFSDLKLRSIWTTLEEAIETNEEPLIESLCIEAARSSGRPNGLVAKAITKARFNSAKVLARHFHSPSDFEDKSGGVKVLAALAEAGQLNLTREILLVCPALPWTSHVYQSALIKTFGKGHRDMLSFLLDQIQLRKRVNITYDAYYCYLIRQAARSDCYSELSTLVDTIGKKGQATGLARCCSDLAANGDATALKIVLPALFKYFSKDVGYMKRFKNLQHIPIDDAVMTLLSATMKNSKKGEGDSFGAAFQLAAYRSQIDVLSRQLEMGIDINNVNGQYGTALQAASRRGHLQVVRWLLERGAQVDTCGGQHGNAIAAAAAKGHVEVLETLLAHGQNPSQEARVNTKKGKMRNTLLLVSDPTTATPLHFAAAEMQVETVQVLAEAGADAAALDSKGNTALHLCIFGPYYVHQWGPEYRIGWGTKLIAMRLRRSCGMIASLLLERGAVATAQNKNGNSPLHLLFILGLAERERPLTLHPCAVQLAKLLFEAGASFDLQNNSGISAREAAIKCGGQQLEDLKREIPSAWEGLEESNCDAPTSPPFSPTSPRVKPAEISKNLLPDLFDDKGILNVPKGEVDDMDDFDKPSPVSQAPDLSWNFDYTSDNVGASYTPSDAAQWTSDSRNEVDINSPFVSFKEDLKVYETPRTNMESYPPGDYWNLPSNAFNDLGSDLFTNPWKDT